MECRDGISSQGSQVGIYVKYAGVLWTRTVGEAERIGVKIKVKLTLLKWPKLGASLRKSGLMHET